MLRLVILLLCIASTASAAPVLHLEDLEAGKTYVADIHINGQPLPVRVLQRNPDVLLGTSLVLSFCLTHAQMAALLPMSGVRPAPDSPDPSSEYAILASASSDPVMVFSHAPDFSCTKPDPAATKDALRSQESGFDYILEGSFIDFLRASLSKNPPPTPPPPLGINHTSNNLTSSNGIVIPGRETTHSLLKGTVKTVHSEILVRTFQGLVSHHKRMYRETLTFSKSGLLTQHEIENPYISREIDFQHDGNKISSVNIVDNKNPAAIPSPRITSTYSYTEHRLDSIKLGNSSNSPNSCLNYLYDGDWVFVKQCSQTGLTSFHFTDDGNTVETAYIAEFSGTLFSAKNSTTGIRITFQFDKDNMTGISGMMNGKKASEISLHYQNGEVVRMESTSFDTLGSRSIDLDAFIAQQYRKERPANGRKTVCAYNYEKRDSHGNPLHISIHCTSPDQSGAPYEYDVYNSISYF